MPRPGLSLRCPLGARQNETINTENGLGDIDKAVPLYTSHHPAGRSPRVSPTLSHMSFRYCLAAIALISLAACSSPAYLPYHSTAAIPHSHRSTATEVTLILGEQRRAERRPYAVLNAVDGGELHYVLFAPALPTFQGANSVRKINLGNGVPMTAEHARAFSRGLGELLAVAGESRNETNGTLYEFSYAPEQDIVRASENVVTWRPSLRFAFSKTESGTAGRLTLGESGGPVHHFRLDDVRAVSDLKALIDEAISNLR